MPHRCTKKYAISKSIKYEGFPHLYIFSKYTVALSDNFRLFCSNKGRDRSITRGTLKRTTVVDDPNSHRWYWV